MTAIDGRMSVYQFVTVVKVGGMESTFLFTVRLCVPFNLSLLSPEGRH